MNTEALKKERIEKIHKEIFRWATHGMDRPTSEIAKELFDIGRKFGREETMKGLLNYYVDGILR